MEAMRIHDNSLSDLTARPGQTVFSPVQSRSLTPDDLGLTPRQADVLYFVLQGMSNKAIGRRLGIAANTVRIHLRPVLRSLNVANRVQVIIAVSRLQFAFKHVPVVCDLNK
ncbi:MAG TPA: LuxR C-terminal-related transcriptional regulator [Burkholderiales bacterium]|nr:LuxR C-terminal-related transcriptional regulator [Burkholderiales bacterium]